MPNALLILEDGTLIKGKTTSKFRSETYGEVVFNTSMTGYVEAFSDPSYAGQILIMTYPMIGNYGVRSTNYESTKIQIRGLVVKEICPQSYRNEKLSSLLNVENIPMIYDVDTRALTLRIRDKGTLKGFLTTNPSSRLSIKNKIADLKARGHPDRANLVACVSTKKPLYLLNRNKIKVVLMDFGVKSSIIKNITKWASVVVVPYDTEAKTIVKYKPHAILLSNGPGNPEHPALKNTSIRTIANLFGRYPIFGICLGHQLLSVALGLKTYKLKFGHRGSNHAVKNLITGKVYITSQNHGYAVSPEMKKGTDILWLNVNDDTVEGIRNIKLGIYSVQFHPEAAPGPNDTTFLFKEFIHLMKCQKEKI